MTNISSIDLYSAKEKCIELSKTNKRLILSGNSPILLTTTILTADIDNFQNNYDKYSNFNGISTNYMGSSYLDSIIMYLNKELGVQGIIDYLPVEDDILDIYEQLSINRRYFDDEIKKYLQSNNIQALFSFKNGKTLANEDVVLTEKISSFSFMGITGITKELSKRVLDAELSCHTAFGGAINDRMFQRLGYEFTDDVIAYNNILNLGAIKGEELNPIKIWPRTVEFTIKNEDDTYILEKIGSVLIDYFEWIEDELKEKGQYNAMSPMKAMVYEKEIH